MPNFAQEDITYDSCGEPRNCGPTYEFIQSLAAKENGTRLRDISVRRPVRRLNFLTAKSSALKGTLARLKPDTMRGQGRILCDYRPAGESSFLGPAWSLSRFSMSLPNDGKIPAPACLTGIPVSSDLAALVSHRCNFLLRQNDPSFCLICCRCRPSMLRH